MHIAPLRSGSAAAVVFVLVLDSLLSVAHFIPIKTHHLTLIVSNSLS
jgi:hypothetical protein